MKKITTLVLSLVLVLAMSITAFAATPNDDVKAALTEAGVTGEYYDQAVKFLANNELTAEQATAVKNEIKAAKATAGEAKSVADLSADQISKIKANIVGGKRRGASKRRRACPPPRRETLRAFLRWISRRRRRSPPLRAASIRS